MEKYKIEKGIPLPRKTKNSKENYPFHKMDVGDSFFVELKKGKKISSLQAQVSSNARSFAKTNNPKLKFSTRKIENKGVRVWRIN